MSSGLTTNYNLPYPISTDPVNVAGDIEQLANKVDFDLKEIIEDTSSIMWITGGTFSNGLQAPTYDDSTGKMSMSLSQDIKTTASPTFTGISLVGGDLYLGPSRTIIFDGSADDTFETTLSVVNPTADRTITFQNATGTVAHTNESTLASLVNISSATGAITIQLGYGATTNGTTKTLNIGGNGVSGSTTNINVGSSVSGALGTFRVNSPTVSIPSTAISLGTVISGVWSGSPITADEGGTGLTSYTVGDIVYASGATTLAKLAGVATGNALVSGGVGVAPSWGKIGLTTHVSGTLPVANGGTGVTTSTGTGNVVLSASPTLTGIPTAPTAVSGTNTTQLATTAFVQTAVSALGGLPSQTGNSGKYLTTNGTVASWGSIDLSGYATLSGSYFTGAVEVQSPGTGTTGGLRVRADSTGKSYIQFTDNTATTEFSHILATSGNISFSTIVNVISPTAAGSKGVRETTMSTATPTGGADGDVWLQYA